MHSARTRFRKVASALSALAVGVAGLTAVQIPAAMAADRTFTLVGSLQNEIGCDADWAPECLDSLLQPTGTENLYAAQFTLPAGTYEYKVAVNGTWDEAYGLNGGDQNIPLVLGGETQVVFAFNDETKATSLTPLNISGDYESSDSALIKEPVREDGTDEQFYFVLTDRFADGDTTNNTAGLGNDPLVSGYDPTNKGFYNGGDIAGLRQKLDYIDGLGATAIWLTPSFKNNPVQGEGENASAGYHGYWITDFTQIDPHLGTNEELKALIDDAHARGIKVYFDIITNHTADLIDNKEKDYSYVEQADVPYRDADGVEFLIQDFAGANEADFPTLDAETSFPRTPTVLPENANKKFPAWLNDVTLYHNRGDSTWDGESVTLGDFNGLDDLMTEHPTVVNGFVDVYQQWVDFGIDGFRIDTVKHVNFEFWETWTKEVLDYAHAKGKSDFFMFGEVFDGDPKVLSPYVRDTDMNSVLDFAFNGVATNYAKGFTAKGLSQLYASDDLYTTANKSAYSLPTFLGNHDLGRIGFHLRETNNPVQRNELAHSLMYLTRGQPVVYYGDEQGFAGLGDGKDKNARQFAGCQFQ